MNTSALKSISPPVYLCDCNSSSCDIQGHHSNTSVESLLAPDSISFDPTGSIFVWRILVHMYTHTHTDTQMYFQMAEVVWLWAPLPQVIRSRHRRNDVFTLSTLRQDGVRTAKRRGGQTWRRHWLEGGKVSGCERNTGACTAGGRASKVRKWMTNDGAEGRRQWRRGSLPVDQITNQSFDWGLLWTETWRITFASRHTHTHTHRTRGPPVSCWSGVKPCGSADKLHMLLIWCNPQQRKDPLMKIFTVTSEWPHAASWSPTK